MRSLSRIAEEEKDGIWELLECNAQLQDSLGATTRSAEGADCEVVSLAIDLLTEAERAVHRAGDRGWVQQGLPRQMLHPARSTAS